MRPEHADLLADILWDECRAQPARGRVAWADALAVQYEGTKRALEGAGAARAAGTWYTPPALVEQVLAAAMPNVPARSFCGCDPACGTGNFLVAIGERLAGAGWGGARIATAVAGMDIDPFAVALARTRLRARWGGTAAAWARAVRARTRLRARWGGTAAAWARAVRAGDSLAAGAWAAKRFALVAGNPPFLGQLAKKTARSETMRDATRERFGGVLTRYADAASAFLLLGCELAAPGGGVALVQPLSALAAGDTAAVRAACERAAPLRAMLFPSPRAFAASVHTCVPILRRGPAPVSVQVVAAGAPAIALPARWTRGGAWGATHAAARGIPQPARAGQPGGGTIGDLATATADFRQHYYGLVGRVHEAVRGRPARGELRLVTVGAIGAAHTTWGSAPIRLHGRAFAAPVIRPRELGGDSVLGPWLRARGVPKILLATQTRAIEGFVDAQAEYMPSTPVITVVPRTPEALWRVAAALLAPSTAAHAWWRHAGAALSPGALKLSASQVLALPAPASVRDWTRGATALRRWQQSQADAERDAFAAAMCDAYGVPTGAPRQALLAWWCRAIAAPEAGAGRMHR